MADSFRYTVRVELHDADDDDYEDLHAYMEKEGFVRYLSLEGGTKLQLPTAEYSTYSNKGKDGVLAKAKAAATNTGKKFMVLVTQSADRAWSNLPEWKSK